MTLTDVTVRLRPDQLEAFHRAGFLALDTLTTHAEVESLRGVYDRLFERRDGFAAGDQLALSRPDEAGRETLPQIVNPERYAPELADTLARTNALAIARQLLGPLADRAGDHAIMKPPGHGAATPCGSCRAATTTTCAHTGWSIPTPTRWRWPRRSRPPKRSRVRSRPAAARSITAGHSTTPGRTARPLHAARSSWASSCRRGRSPRRGTSPGSARSGTPEHASRRRAHVSATGQAVGGTAISPRATATTCPVTRVSRVRPPSART